MRYNYCLLKTCSFDNAIQEFSQAQPQGLQNDKSKHVYDGVIFEGVFTFILVLVFLYFEGVLKEKQLFYSHQLDMR